MDKIKNFFDLVKLRYRWLKFNSYYVKTPDGSESEAFWREKKEEAYKEYKDFKEYCKEYNMPKKYREEYVVWKLKRRNNQ